MNNKIGDNLKYILHSLCHIGVIEKINIKCYYDFISDYLLIDVVILRLQQIGENVSKLTDNFKEEHNNINFRAIKNFRNIIVHNYDGLDYEDIYAIIEEDLPDLKEKYEKIIINEFKLGKDFIDDYVNYYIKKRIFKDII